MRMREWIVLAFAAGLIAGTFLGAWRVTDAWSDWLKGAPGHEWCRMVYPEGA